MPEAAAERTSMVKVKASQALRMAVQEAVTAAAADGRPVANAYDLLVGLLNDGKLAEAVRQAGGDAEALIQSASAAARVTAPVIGWATQMFVMLGVSEPAKVDDVARSAIERAAAQMASAGREDYTSHHILAELMESEDRRLVDLIHASGLSRINLLKYVSHGDSAIAVPAQQEAIEGDVVDVLIHNDDYTTMELVVHILCDAFELEQPEAVRIMLRVHKEGLGVVRSLPRTEAVQRVQRAVEMARAEAAPLKITIAAAREPSR